MAWTDIADKVERNLFGYIEHNRINANLKYIHDTILGDPDSNSNAVDFTQGLVTVSHADGLEVDYALTMTGVLVGYRTSIQFFGTNISATDYIKGGGNSSGLALGFVAPRNGSIVGASYYWNVTAHSADETATIRIRNDESNLAAFSGATASAVTVYTDTLSAARNTYQFSAGEALEIYYDVTSAGTITSNLGVTLDLILDT